MVNSVDCIIFSTEFTVQLILWQNDKIMDNCITYSSRSGSYPDRELRRL